MTMGKPIKMLGLQMRWKYFLPYNMIIIYVTGFAKGTFPTCLTYQQTKQFIFGGQMIEIHICSLVATND